MSQHNYTMISGSQVWYESNQQLDAFIERLQRMAASPSTTEDDLIAIVYSAENPIMDQQAIPGRGAVTAEVMANPAYQVMTDILFRKAD